MICLWQGGIILIVATLAHGCCAIKHLDTKTFLAEASKIEYASSIGFTEYVGHSRDRIYLQDYQGLRTGFKYFWPKTMIYWTELNGLPDEMLNTVKSGQSPWVPFGQMKNLKAR